MNRHQPVILVVDDTETNIDILVGLLQYQNAYDVVVATDGKSAIEIATNEKIDLILLDIMMPNLDGYSVCKILKKNDKTKNIPIIFITAKTDEDSIEKAYDVGGADYVEKPFRQRELLARVKNQLDVKTLIENLEYIASYDTMTELYNRRKFFEVATKRFDIEENLFGVMIDIDRFKEINDTYGHQVGDNVIKKVASIISSNLCNNSIYGRIGGEEFAILCLNEDIEKIISHIEFIREEVEKSFVESDKGIVKFTISNGIAKKDKDTKTIDDLLKNADEALYKAKGDGRNKVIFRS